MNDVHFKAKLDELFSEIIDLLARKNADYGSSFSEQFKKYGMTSSVIRIEDKFRRLENLVKNEGNAHVKDESILDTCRDMIGYLALTILEREK